MESLTKKLDSFIVNNSSDEKGISIREVIAHFTAEGYSIEEIRKAYAEFCKKRCGLSDEYDT